TPHSCSDHRQVLVRICLAENMGRAPCCDKNGLKKGPWTPEEDQKLIDYIQKHGYGNWRTLPKNAVNPELLRLATTLMSSQRETTQDLLFPNGQENQLGHVPHIQNQYQPLNQFQTQEMPTCTSFITTTTTTACVPFSHEAQLMDNSHNVEQYPSNVTDFSPQNSDHQLSHDNWQSNIMASNLSTGAYVPVQDYSNYYGSDQATIIDPSSETSTFISNNSNNNNFSFAASVLSTPSSSPTPLNSNSTYINSSSSTTEDERESYCSNMLKFEVPDHILD
ncbi:hypothetical protein Tsubulata_015338, partial [Turnera subulata]